ncbi:putative DCC family thiol-disulfide oxidoreductase YuxK [Lewinella aquimaris]|uniref:Putative DCC family thiol-disulfide oxidoreductase YuxK n=1 Tax=Neolewinella aquimaris TaxID=1835722 RepID=A0A840EA44_9BACT|nr:thiol-disulfide oxidoreductase DCC family protein [Neolewinella aquimaris]MBB4080257.1 putative DCC family thiol-disulfide oxidoreductase YuxK [Neolewinella aquimaris]
MEPSHPILFFDGVCNLCNGAVQFILKHDRRGVLRFASLQSDLAAELLPQYGVDPGALSSVVLYENGKVYTHSDGVLRTLKLMGGPLSYLSYLGIVPPSLRDIVYDLIGYNRYSLFGKREQCMLPRPEWKSRFVAS